MTSGLRGRRARAFAWAGVLGLVMVPSACAPGEGTGEGPGHRQQVLALTPEQELSLGRQAYHEILEQIPVLPTRSPEVQRVRRVGQRLVRATEIEPLLREINLHEEGYEFRWEFNVLDDDQVNAFCLPGGKVGVFVGLLEVAEDDDQLAAVLGHEMAHALAHHASERVARQPEFQSLLGSADVMLGRMGPERRRELIGLLSAGAGLRSLAYNRREESEADHIGVFLMTFAGYDPAEALAFWERMRSLSERRGQLPEILSDHPSDARRIRQLQEWVPLALGAKRAYDEGRIEPAPDR